MQLLPADHERYQSLVERAPGFVMLLHLPHTHKALDVQKAMTTAMSRLPHTLRLTLTWDQGQENGQPYPDRRRDRPRHLFLRPALTLAAQHQRNTNGLFAPLLSEVHRLSGYHPDYLEFVAVELNNRPRKRLGWRTPAERLQQLLSTTDDNPPGVALAS